MRTKSFLIGLCGVVITSALLILFSSAGQPNENLKNIVSQTHQQIREFQVIILLLKINSLHFIDKMCYRRTHIFNYNVVLKVLYVV